MESVYVQFQDISEAKKNLGTAKEQLKTLRGDVVERGTAPPTSVILCAIDSALLSLGSVEERLRRIEKEADA